MTVSFKVLVYTGVYEKRNPPSVVTSKGPRGHAAMRMGIP